METDADSDPYVLLARTPPFDRLAAADLAWAAAQTGRVALPTGAELHAELAEHLYFALHGHLLDDEGTAAACADPLALLRAEPRSRWRVPEGADCLRLPRHAVLELCARSPGFARHLSAGFDARATRDPGLAGFALARIGDAYLHPPLVLAEATPLREAARAMKAAGLRAALVARGAGELGLVSTTDLRDAVLIGERPASAPVADIASFPLVALDADDFLFDALLAMTRHGIGRVAVHRGGEIAGILEQLDLLSFLAGDAHLIALRIARATDRDELARAGADLLGMVRTLHARGVKPRYLGRLIGALNKQLLAKLYALIAPPRLLADSCLLVMGSEGREEQILKTDQDNALILRDGAAHAEAEHVARVLNQALGELGWPPCPGGIMVTNPLWCKPLAAFKDSIFDWIRRPSAEGHMHFAIFADARAVAGDPALLDAARAYIHHQLDAHRGFYAHFARATLAFDTPLGLFSQFRLGRDADHRDELDLKKGGIFALVHGIRSLALEGGIAATNTFERIEALRGRGALEPRLAGELAAALDFLSGLRLAAGLRKINAGGPPDNYIEPQALGLLERETLRDALKIVNDFKKLIAFHFRLDLVP